MWPIFIDQYKSNRTINACDLGIEYGTTNFEIYKLAGQYSTSTNFRDYQEVKVFCCEKRLNYLLLKYHTMFLYVRCIKMMCNPIYLHLHFVSFFNCCVWVLETIRIKRRYRPSTSEIGLEIETLLFVSLLTVNIFVCLIKQTVCVLVALIFL